MKIYFIQGSYVYHI